eukprot:8326926-Pyramimonas_sp.AAC.1
MQKYKQLNRNMKKIEREEWARKLYTEAKVTHPVPSSSCSASTSRSSSVLSHPRHPRLRHQRCHCCSSPPPPLSSRLVSLLLLLLIFLLLLVLLLLLLLVISSSSSFSSSTSPNIPILPPSILPDTSRHPLSALMSCPPPLQAKREKAKIETETQREWGTMMNLDSIIREEGG